MPFRNRQLGDLDRRTEYDKHQPRNERPTETIASVSNQAAVLQIVRTQ